MNAFADLVDALSPDRMGDARYRGGIVKRSLPRLFGGQVVAQALMASSDTVDVSRAPNSLHCYFLRGGDSSKAIDFTVDSLRDGRHYSVRHVTAEQDGRVLLHLMCSFHAEEPPTLAHGVDNAVADLEMCSSWEEWRATSELDLPDWWSEEIPFDIRFAHSPTAVIGGGTSTPDQVLWIRPRGPVGENPAFSAALLSYALDLNLLDAVINPHGRSWYGPGRLEGASLDYALWFHSRCPWDDWIRVAQRSPHAGAGRGLAECLVHDSSGRLRASAGMEGVIRRGSSRV